MKNAFSNPLQLAFVIFISINIALYVFINSFAGSVPFHSFNYVYNAHHYLRDPRIDGGEFNFLRALGTFDAQWYLKIASSGYPKNPDNSNQNETNGMNGLTYAFFPAYPLLISAITVLFFFSSIEQAAFFLSNVLLIANFLSMYYVISRLFSTTIALRTAFLLLFFPFSIFFRSYFTEGLYLFFLIWFSYFFMKKDYIFAAVLLGILSVTRGNGLFIIPLFLVFLTKDVLRKNTSITTAGLTTVLMIFPFFLWLGFNYFQTGNPFYFQSVQSNWFTSQHILSPLLHNLSAIISFPTLAFHLFHSSKVDVVSMLAGLIILIVSRKSLPRQLWWISFCLWILPLVVKDLISFSRFQIVIFPFFIYLAMILRGKLFLLATTIFTIMLFIVGLYFVNWYWVG